jgi:hypothetical protein
LHMHAWGIDTIHRTGLKTAHALPLTLYKNLRATCVSHEIVGKAIVAMQ